MVPIRLLQKFELFEGLNEEELEEIAAICREETYEAGMVIFRQGDAAGDLFFVVDGQVALEMGVELWPGAPLRQVTVETVSRGEAFGWSALVGPHILTLSARCLSPTKLIAIPGEGLRRLLERNPQVGYRVIDQTAQLTASRLRETRDKLIEFLCIEELPSDFTPEEATLLQRVQYFINFRWIAAAGIAAVALFAKLVLMIELPLLMVLLLAAALALYNFGLLVYSRRMVGRAEPTLLKKARGFIQLQGFIDLVALTALIHFTGGIENPFIFYYVFHILIAGVLLPYRSAYLLTSVAALLIVGLAGLEYFGIIPHRHLYGFLPFEIYHRGPTVLGVLFALITTLYVCTYIATSIAGELRKRQREVAVLKDKYLMNIKELEETNRKLVELDRLRTHFLAIASHDLKAPLAAVQSYLGVILGGFVGDVSERQRVMLERSSMRLTELLNLINDILDATRIETGQIVQEMEMIELGSVIENALENVRSQAEHKGLRLECDLADRLPRIKASARRLGQVLTNLLSNAVQFTPSGGEIKLSVKDLQAEIEVTVQDTGVGITPEDLPRIFEAFYRSKGVETKGAGLGLAIAQKIVEAHGGRIWAESPDPQTGKGSVFTFTLPKGALR